MMYMIRISIASALVCLGALSAQAQSAQELQLLRQNPDLAQQFMGNGGVLQQDAQTQNIPTAQKPRTLNAEDALDNQNVLLQSQAGPTTEESVIQRYYRILTGELLDVYGAQEFGQQQDSQLLFFNTMGKDYRLAAGDVLRVTLRGLTESDQTYTIGRDGNLILPSLAPIAVSGLSIAEAEEKLLNILRYDDAAASVYMSLDTARLVTVQVSGAVKNPRTLAVPAYTPLSRVLAYSGGIKPTGSLRNIVLRDRDGSVSKVDFYDFLQSPIGANDPVVTDASRIFVSNQNNTVAAMGFVARPGIYELDEEVSEISVRALLELSGTRILAPGTTLEALFVDAEGYTQRRALTQSGTINAGEVLNLRFLATRLTDAVNVRGAVLEEYQIATTQPLMISDLLKDGATLKPEAFRDIAVIVSESARARALDLERILSDQEEMIHPGETLHILTSAQLRKLAGTDINSERSVLLDALLEADVAELYLNGKRIAYLPTSDDERFSDALRPFYRVTPDTTLELAIIDNTNGDAEAVSLRELLVSNNPYPIETGDRIYLFEDKFLQLNTDDIAEAGSLISAPAKTTWRDLSKLFGRANVTRITLNHEVRAFLPQKQTNTLQNVLDILGNSKFRQYSGFRRG
jgi:protein involved in polysaccharide export with SLBB domain